MFFVHKINIFIVYLDLVLTDNGMTLTNQVLNA